MTVAVILSGGRGERLKPLTDLTPKPMLTVGDRPHLEHIITLLKRNYIRDIIFSTGYLHDMIVQHFGDGSDFGIRLQYCVDGDFPLGTAGGLKNCEDAIGNENTIIVINGDILTNFNLPELIMQHQMTFQGEKGITIGLVPVPDPENYGVATFRTDGSNKIVAFKEKPKDAFYGNLINAGIYVMSREVLEDIPKGQFSMLETDVFPVYAQEGRLNGYADIGAYWLDIGTIERYQQANQDYLTKKFSFVR